MSIIRSQFLFLTCMFSKKGCELCAYITILLGGFIIAAALLVAFTNDAEAKSRIKDIVSVEGIRDNMLVGYGLVVGLNGTGDKMKNSVFTEKSLKAFLERQGVNTAGTELKAKNVAAVTITATLPPFARNGSKIDVTVSTLGDSKSLQGGTLIATPIMGADGEVYAVAQGAVTIGGFASSGKSGSRVSKGVPTNGFLPNGAIIEKEVDFELNSLKNINFALRNPDIATAIRIAEAINSEMTGDIAFVRDPGTVLLTIPSEYQNSVASLLGKVEQLMVEPDQAARIIIDEASGTIVMNANVRLDTVAIAQGNLVVTITETELVSQPNAFAPEGAETVTVPESTISVDENGGNKMAILESGANLKDLVGGLNSLGVGPRDLISILQTIKVAGALQAEIESR